MVTAGGGEDEQHHRLAGKEYKKAVEALCRSSAVRVTDLDQKAIALLDALQERGRADEACEYLRQMIEGIEREKVHSWRAYSYSLLRKFDESVYMALKGQQGDRSSRNSRGARAEARPKVERKKTGEATGVLNPFAAEFVPGHYWGVPAYPAPAYPAPIFATPAPPVEAAKPTNSAAVSTDTGSAKSDKEEVPVRPAIPEGGFELGSPEMPSVGSAGHFDRKCKPCAFFGTKGCNSGVQCGFCHICGPDEKKQRKKEKRLAAQSKA